jgi:cell division protein FtsL
MAWQIKHTLLWGLILAAFIGQLLFYTWCRVQCVQIGYDITVETDKYQRLMALQNSLRIEMARLKSPDRIARIARQELGLKTPGPQQTIVIP